MGIRTWRALAAKAGVSYETVRALKAGGRVAAASEYAIEQALRWAPGSIQRIREGGEPAVLDDDGFDAFLQVRHPELSARQRRRAAEMLQRWLEDEADA